MTSADLLKRFTPALFLALGLPLMTHADAPANQDFKHSQYKPRLENLVNKVYQDNIIYKDITVARSAGYSKRLTECVSGPEFGAMGIHMANLSLVMDGVITSSQPEIIIYEPQADGRVRMVGVEYLIPAPLWKPTPEEPVPSVEGVHMNFIPGPNRYGNDALWELHVWAFERNPLGAYADWNTQVSCERQPLTP